MRRCPRCNKELPNEAFFKNASNKSGLSDHCKQCFKAYESQPDRKAKSTWHTINARIKRQRSYQGVEVRMTQQEFLDWAIPKYREWSLLYPNLTPSIDRIDSKGHYELSNIRLIERGENSRLAGNHPNVHAPDGKAWCHSCKDYLDKSLFWKSSSSYNGLQARCKACHSEAMRRSASRAVHLI